MDEANESLAAKIVAGLHKIGLAQRHQAWKLAGPRGLTPTQEQVLVAVRAAPDGLPVGRLAELLAVSAPTVSDAVKTLEDKGHILRTRDPADRRVVHVTLSESGRATANAAAGWSDFLIEAVDALTADEQQVFLRGVMKMIFALQRHGQIPLARMCLTCRYFRPNAHAGQPAPHHCAFVDAPLAATDLRTDCADHQSADLAGVSFGRLDLIANEPSIFFPHGRWSPVHRPAGGGGPDSASQSPSAPTIRLARSFSQSKENIR